MIELKSKTITGLKWSAFGVFAQVILQTGVIAVLARMISPESFGLLAMANVLVQFVNRFSQLGLGPALIQRPDIDSQDIRASFTLAVGLGLIFGLLTWLSAPLAALYFKTDKLVPIIHWLSFSFVFSGMSLTAQNLLRRELKFGASTFVEVFSFGVGYVGVSIVLAYLGFGVWSLVVGILVQQFLLLVTSFAFARHSILPIFSWGIYRRSLRFGAHFSLNSVLDYIYVQVDVLLLGRHFSEAMVGIYDRSYKLTHLPVQRMAMAVTKVMFPAFSRLQDDPPRLSRVFTKTFTIVGLMAAGICGGIIPAAQEIVKVVLGPQWDAAILPLQILAIAVPLHYLISVQGVLLDSMDRLGARTSTRVVGILLKTGLLVYAATLSFHQFLAAIGLSLFLQLMVSSYYVIRHGRVRLGSLMGSLATMFGDALIVAIAIYGVTLVGRAAGLPTVVLLVAQIFTGGVAMLVVFAAVMRFSLFGITVQDFASLPVIGKLIKRRIR